MNRILQYTVIIILSLTYTLLTVSLYERCVPFTKPYICVYWNRLSITDLYYSIGHDSQTIYLFDQTIWEIGVQGT